MEQQNGKLYAATRGIECISRVTLTASGQLDQHILASTTSLSDRRRRGNRGGWDGGESGPYGCYGRKLSFNQRFQDIRRFPTIYAGVARAGFFGLHVNSRALRWCVNQARRHVRWQSCDR